MIGSGLASSTGDHTSVTSRTSTACAASERSVYYPPTYSVFPETAWPFLTLTLKRIINDITQSLHTSDRAP